MAREYLDYNDWLAKAAGKKKPQSEAIVNKSADSVKKKVVKRVIKRRVVHKPGSKPQLISSRTTLKKAKAKSSAANTRVVKAGTPTKKKISPAQRRAWQQGLAKLQQKSKSDYKKASYQYRKAKK